jgi:hypothetical protein
MREGQAAETEERLGVRAYASGLEVTPRGIPDHRHRSSTSIAQTPAVTER